jgi:hypothetical protein
MKIFKIFIIVIAVLFSGLLIITFLLPTEAIIKRDIIISTGSEIPYNLVNDLNSWKDWFPVFQIDSRTMFVFQHNKNNLHSSMKWYSDSQNVGRGHLKIMYHKANKNLKILITLQNDKQGILNFIFAEKNNSTNLILEYRTELDFFEKWMGFILESVIGPTLEKSIKNIKSISEYKYLKGENQEYLKDNHEENINQ